MAAGLEGDGSAMQEAVEFIHQKVDRLVGIVGGDGRDEVGAADLDVALGDEGGAAAGGVVFYIEADAVDAGFVAEEAIRFAVQGIAHGVGEGEVDASKQELRAGVSGGMCHSEKV